MLDLEWKCAMADSVHRKLRRAVCVPTERYLWVPEDAITFIPALSPRIYGDGRALMQLTTINSRPQFYVLRVDSRWVIDGDFNRPCGAPEFVDFVDDILWHLEEDFGCWEADSEEDDPEILEDGNPWPALDDDGGCSWARADWPELRGMRFGRNPLSWRDRLLLESPARQRRRDQIAAAERDIHQTV